MSGNSKQIITIDGPAGAGKSTVAKQLARKLNISYLDTGAMYRALTFKAIQQNIDLEDEEAIVAMAKQTNIDLESHGPHAKVLLDGKDVSEDIRSMEVTNKTFYIAQKPRVRAIMVDWQRKLGAKKSIVIEGRDVGTVVFPQANKKFYLDANVHERSRRRMEELREKGSEVDKDQLTAELKERDNKDLTRRVGPLKKAEDAVYIDTTHLSVEEVIDEMMKYIQQ
jgi:cytidylate kinase